MSDSNEVLVVASKVKSYIKATGDMKTSGGVLQTLSDRIRILCDQAVENARSDGRKTVLDRDFS
jgi:histone H3/H4